MPQSAPPLPTPSPDARVLRRALDSIPEPPEPGLQPDDVPHVDNPSFNRRPTKPGQQPRGFALMTAERRRELAAAGGRAAQRNGGGHRFTSEEARDAGR